MKRPISQRRKGAPQNPMLPTIESFDGLCAELTATPSKSEVLAELKKGIEAFDAFAFLQGESSTVVDVEELLAIRRLLRAYELIESMEDVK